MLRRLKSVTNANEGASILLTKRGFNLNSSNDAYFRGEI